MLLFLAHLVLILLVERGAHHNAGTCVYYGTIPIYTTPIYTPPVVTPPPVVTLLSVVTPTVIQSQVQMAMIQSQAQIAMTRLMVD